MGNANAGDVLVAKQGVTQLLQNPESFGNFWDQVEATETLWETKAWILVDISWNSEPQKGMGKGTKIIDWVLTRTI